jgi:transposase
MVDKSPTQELVTLRTGREVEEVLRELFLERGYSDREIGIALDVSRTTVNKWRRQFGIKGPRPAPATLFNGRDVA